ncbi:hypothetical protein FGIG_05332 [Fasciola gigantica]|uniref:Uncharacterized protein n=1 Tax=Fasciola gigantica TaxID=46835 RepID=A0A504YPJ2_FASGI|nr:hypothetical protein FGIG_05332 [Fasciola gigantica]
MSTGRGGSMGPNTRGGVGGRGGRGGMGPGGRGGGTSMPRRGQ